MLDVSAAAVGVVGWDYCHNLAEDDWRTVEGAVESEGVAEDGHLEGNSHPDPESVSQPASQLM